MHQGYSNPDTQDLPRAYCTPAWRKAENAFVCSARRIRCTSALTPVAARVSIEIAAMTRPIGTRAVRSLNIR